MKKDIKPQHEEIEKELAAKFPVVEQPITSTALYSAEDREELDKLMKTVINDYGKLEIFYNAYKKYVDASAPRPIAGCGNCALSIETYFTNLRDWYVKNGELFA